MFPAERPTPLKKMFPDFIPFLSIFKLAAGITFALVLPGSRADESLKIPVPPVNPPVYGWLPFEMKVTLATLPTV